MFESTFESNSSVGTLLEEVGSRIAHTLLGAPQAPQPSNGALPRLVVAEEFLVCQELDAVIDHALRNEAGFSPSLVISPEASEGRVDMDHRRSRVLSQLGDLKGMIWDRVAAILSRVFDDLRIAPEPITRLEAQMTATNDGEFFRMHRDNVRPSSHQRRISFVYFFNRDPRPFSGGELRIYGKPGGVEGRGAPESYRDVIPVQNSMVFFPSECLHEIRPVCCPSRAFTDSRFTLNGWLHVADAPR